MAELLTKYLLILLTYAIFLSAFLIIRKKQIKKWEFLFAILVYSALQLYTDKIDVNRGIIYLKDFGLMMIFLVLCEEKQNLLTFFYAFLISSFLPFCFLFQSAFLPYELLLKLLFMIAFYNFIKQIKRIEAAFPYKRVTWGLFLLSLGNVVLTFFLFVRKYDQNHLRTILRITALFYLVMYLIMKYLTLWKNYKGLVMRTDILDLAVKQTELLMQEQKHMRKLLHDTKNQFLLVDTLLQEEKYSLIHKNIQEFLSDFSKNYVVSLCNNPYLDAVLRQVMKRHATINFNFKIQVPDKLALRDEDLFVILTKLIDAVCNQIIENNIQVVILGNEDELSIRVTYVLLEELAYAKKEDVTRLYSDKAMNFMINKYAGHMQIKNTSDHSSVMILLFYH